MEITVREPSIARYFRQRRTLFRFRRPTHRQPRLPKKKHRTGRVASRYQATSGSIHRLPARAETEVKPKIRLRIPPIKVRRLAWTDSRVRTWLETGAEGVRSRADPFWTVRAPTAPFCWA